MKINRSTNWIRIALACLALAFVVILLPILLLAKGISQIVGNPIEPEKLDIRPIPVPVPPTPLAINELPVSAIPAPSLSAIIPVPEAIPVPTSPASGPQTASSFAQASQSELSTTLAIPIVNWEGVIVIVLTFLFLLTSVWLHRLPGPHSFNRKNA